MKYKLCDEEQKKRCGFVEHIRYLIKQELPICSEDDISLLIQYREYYLQISFSEVHPLMMFSLAKTYPESQIDDQIQKTQ